MDTNAFISQAISVRLLRIKKKQYQLASELNIDQTVLSHYMTGKSSWNAKVTVLPLSSVGVLLLTSRLLQKRNERLCSRFPLLRLPS